MPLQVDILSHRNKSARVVTQIKDICAILSGLLVAQDYRRGQDLIRDRNFKDNEEFFQVRLGVMRRMWALYRVGRCGPSCWQHKGTGASYHMR